MLPYNKEISYAKSAESIEWFDQKLNNEGQQHMSKVML